MADTTSSVLSQVLQAELQDGLLENLRNRLVFGNRAWAEMGRFVKGADAIKFASVPDLAVATTPLTEGSPPTAVALSVAAVTVDSMQYGNLVSITDLAAVKSPVDLVATARERLARNGAETIDQLVRDEVALGGTMFLAEAGSTLRTDLDSGDIVTRATLLKLAARMFYGDVEPFDDGFFILIVSPGVAYDIMADTATGGFVQTHQYTDPRPLIRGEIGSLAQFRIIKAQNAPTFASTITVHASLALGRLPGWGWGDLQTFATYYTAPGGSGDELHQKESVGWKVAFGVAQIDNARYFRLESAATDVTGVS